MLSHRAGSFFERQLILGLQIKAFKSGAMIGFEDEVDRPGAHLDEDADTAGLEKPQLYENVSAVKYVAPYGTRGIKRKYLVDTIKGRVFSVGHSELRHFEVDLDNSQTKRLGSINNGLVVRKINMLQASRRDPELGFNEFEPPEQVDSSHQPWLVRIARYIDRTNLAEIFEAPVNPEPPLTDKSSNISIIYHGRKKAYKYLMAPKAPRENRKFWEGLRDVSDRFREYQNQNFVVEQMRREAERAHQKSLEMQSELQDLISKSAMMYVTLKNPAISPNMIFKASQNNDASVQREADEAYRL